MGTATAKQDRQLGENKEPSGRGKRFLPERFRVAPQAILSVTDHSERVQSDYRNLLKRLAFSDRENRYLDLWSR